MLSLMNARTALRRCLARYIARPDFDRHGIPGIDDLERELRAEFPEFFKRALSTSDDETH